MSKWAFFFFNLTYEYNPGTTEHKYSMYYLVTLRSNIFALCTYFFSLFYFVWEFNIFEMSTKRQRRLPRRALEFYRDMPPSLAGFLHAMPFCDDSIIQYLLILTFDWQTFNIPFMHGTNETINELGN